MDDKDFEANYELLKDLQNADEIYEASPLYEEKERQFREQCEADKKSYEREKETGKIEDDYDSLIN